jgi:tetratricopeptide (TPR) repeat protein
MWPRIAHGFEELSSVARDLDTVFLISIEPPLWRGDWAVLLARLREGWPPAKLVELLASPLSAVARVAATCLGMTGTMEHCPPLVSLLGHADPEVAAAAEDALWCIWMRAGSAHADARLTAAVQCLDEGDGEAALGLLQGLAAEEDCFAEAFHQQALVLHTLERYDEAEASYQQAIELNPYHFAAVAGLGHLCVQRGAFAAALRYYHWALHIHPRLMEIREIVPQLEAAVERRGVA